MATAPTAGGWSYKQNWLYPPYSQSALAHTNATYREFASRNGNCSRSSSWRYGWLGANGHSAYYLSGEQLAKLVPANERIALMGDSLFGQLETSWRARLYESCGGCSGGRSQQLTWCSWYNLLPFVAANGATPLIERLRSRNPPEATECGLEWASPGASRATVAHHLRWDYHLALMDRSEYLNCARSSSVVLVNAFLHLGIFIEGLQRQYKRCGGAAASDAAAVASRAVGDALELWALSLNESAAALATLRASGVSVYYVLSQPPATLFCREDAAAVPRREEAWGPAHGVLATRSCAAPLSLQAYNRLQAAPDHEIARLSSSHAAYHHDLWREVNRMSEHAFAAHGHGILRWQQAFRGTRVDAHPGSTPGSTRPDMEHFCMPGVPDLELDVLLNSLYLPAAGRNADHHSKTGPRRDGG